MTEANFNTRATGKAMPTGEQVSDAIMDLETPICDAVIMAKIASRLAETLIRGRQTIHGQQSYVLSLEAGEVLSWAIYHAEERALAVKDGWSTANELAFKLRRA